MERKLKLISGNSNLPLAQDISSYLNLALTSAEIKRFSDGEISVKINENVRGADVFIIQSTNPPAENLLELLLMIDAASRASAYRITAVIPYYGYARQDRKDQPRVPISAKLVANLITVAGANRFLTMDLHSAPIQGYFDIPSDHLFSSQVFNQYFLDLNIPNSVTVAPDVGSVKMVRAFAKALGTPLAIVDKRRPSPNQSEIMHIIGEVEDKNVIIRDDMIDTGGTLVEAALELAKKGAKEIYACCTHPVFSGKCLQMVEESPIKQLVVADTILTENKVLPAKVKVLSSAEIFGEAILRTYKEESISSLFD